MMRFLSILVLLGGLVAAGLGAARLLEHYRPAPVAASMDSAPMTESAPPPVEAPAEMEMEMESGMDMDSAPMEAEPEAAAEPPPPPPAEMSTESAPMTKSTRSLSLPEPERGEVFTESAPVDDGAADERVRGFAAAPSEEEILVEPSVAMDAAAPAKSAAQVFMESLKTVPVAHETPATAEYKRPFDVTFAIDATGDDTAADALPGRGNVVEGTAKVSDRVEARLSGAAFEIKPLSPEVQNLSPVTENTWRWSVTPLTAGSHDLVFEVFAIDQDSVVPLRTFHDTVTVKVSGINRAIAFVDQANPLAMFLGGIGSVVGGLFGALRFVRKR